MNRANPTALIIWAHGTGDAMKRRRDLIIELLTLLRRFGVVTDVDLFKMHDPVVDWTRWGAARILEVDYVLVIASREWKERWEGSNAPVEGAGSVAEIDVLKSLFNRNQMEFRRKVKVVLMGDATTDDVPLGLDGVPRFPIMEMNWAGVEDLVRTLTGQPKYVPPPVGEIPILPLEMIDAVNPARDLDPEGRYHELRPISDQLDLLREALRRLPAPGPSDGPHLPWYREWQRMIQKIAELEHEKRRLEAASKPPKPWQVQPHPPVGVVFEVPTFQNPNARGVAADHEEIGQADFGANGYRLWVAEGVQHVSIPGTAQQNGDVGIARHVEARPGEVYRLTALVRIRRQRGPFKCRINISPRELGGPQTGEEGNRSLDESTETPVKLVCEQKMHPGTEQLTARVKFHTFDPSDGGEGEIHSVKLERLR